ncbi:T9SS type B sorting domain-containing protein [Chryseobacterium koreense]|uniref:T9SS type B sorting domain-containing protein n=3 Tax=Chryseobacterium koreense TaxID=232216 RepID=UPI00160E822F|nr:T9SS type B sorting domain-containing protein [Chryseobacterium koreense]MBB5332797.1 gliding motility-associated-like protein [Chryseobacterium koreense]
MKKLLLLLFSLFYFFSNAQLDREHWFAPMVDRVGNSSQNQSIYMSTSETTPFKVDVYFNNAVIASYMISKNNPGRHIISNTQRSQIITTSQASLFKPVAMGYYLNGDKPFFASLRFSVNNHGEIQTSKGTAGKGTEFRAVMAPITVSNSILNFMTSVMATEDNTSVTVTGFQPNVVFSDNVPRTQITFTLNKGQSYIIDGFGSYSQNFQGFVGAKIIASKPVVIANGNFNGQYAGNYSSSSDILMDQGVPVDRLGTDFILMKGNGNVYNNMEKAMVVAHEDGTQVFVNGNPIAVANLNAGQFYLTDNTAYIQQGGTHYNMYVRTSKNAYVYQLLAGDGGSSEVATGGFNYIPPLSCYLPKKIDEIGKIDENYFVSNGNPGGLLNVPTKLNVITEKGAIIDIKRNGVSLPITASNGPYNVSGNNNWVTYSFPGISGNVAIFSSRAVTAGISAGNDAVGYGGYFAGFSFIPAIIKTDGNCLPGVTLSVTEGFSSYLWLIKNPDGTYSPAPGINNTFNYSPTQAGIYAVKIQEGSCPEIQTADFKFYNCTTYTDYEYDICDTTTINPAFALSTQALIPASVKIETPPTKGTATVNTTTGVITYVANVNATGTDTFKYSFKGNGSIPDTETAQATIHLNQIEHYDQVLNACSATGTAVFNLTSAAVTPDTSATKAYFTDAALTNPIPTAQWANYTSAPGFVYVKLTNAFGCATSAKIELKITAPPVVTPTLYTKIHCDEDIDGIIDGVYKVDLSTITPVIVQNATAFTVLYYTSLAFANAGGTNNITGVHSFSATNNSVWIRVVSPSVCGPVVMQVTLNIGPKVSITNPVNEGVCDVGLDNTENINLNNYITGFTPDTSVTVKFFASLADAQNNSAVISAAQTITGNTTFYYRFSKAGFCDEIGVLNISFKSGTPSPMLPPTVTVCQGGTTVLNIGPGYTGILWSTGATTQTITAGVGTYTVTFTNSEGCTHQQTVTVTESPKPVWNLAAFNGANCDDNFDGIIPVNLNLITPQIITNASLFTVRYYLNATDAAAGNNNFIPNPATWSYTANTTVWVRTDSAYCPGEWQPLNFTFGTDLPLITNADSVTVCDNDLNNTENINLGNYRNLFTADAAATVRYFSTLANAQANTPNIPAAQTITGNTTFYYRFKKAGFCDVIGKLDVVFKQSTPTALLNAYTICQGSSITLNAETIYTAWLWKKGTTVISTTNTATLTGGVYTIAFTNASGCVFTKTITVTESPKPVWNLAAFNGVNCDDNFDGIIPVNLNLITPQIITNASLFTVRYYLNATDAAAGNNNFIPNPATWSYTANTTVWVRTDSAYCPGEWQPLNFTFGTDLPLITNADSVTVCDNDLNNTENINLGTYRNLFTADAAATVRYFSTLANAQANTPNIPAAQTITGNTTFYYRFKKAGFCDVIGKLDIVFKQSTPTALLSAYTICQGSSITLNAETTYTAWLWKKGTTVISTTNTATLTGGVYTIAFTNASGCVFTKTITVTESPKPIWKLSGYNFTGCDDNFDGVIPVNLDVVTNSIITNASLFTVHYYLNLSDAVAGNNNYIANPSAWSYSANTTIWVRANSPHCPPEWKQLDFKFGPNIPLITSTADQDVCDNTLSGSTTVTLSDYKNLFTADNAVSVKYFDDLTKAQNDLPGEDISATQTITANKTFYLRFHKTGFCDVIGTLNLKFKQPKPSTILKDKAICPGTITELDPGSDFDGYLWSTGETTQTIDVPVGNYWVDLYWNGCVYRQNVKVTAVALPVITAVEIKGSTVTVQVTGGNPPYQYAIDSGNYQSSNVFYNVKGGDHTIFVISADNCAPVTADIYVFEPYNVITPNGDGFNDVLNYSGMLKKEEPFMQIYDRYGKLIFAGDQANRFTWNGTANGKPVPTGSYWVVMHWIEPGMNSLSEYTGWVLVKNRD